MSSFNQNNRKRKSKLQNQAMVIMSRFSDTTLPIGRSIPLNSMQSLAKEVGRIRKNLNVERKFLDQLSSAQTVGAGSSVVLAITPPAGGSSESTREGNSIKVIRFDIKMQFGFGPQADGLAVSCNQTFNWYLIRWKKTPTSSGSTPPAISDIFNQDVNSNYTTLSLLNATTNQNYQFMASGTSVLELPNYNADTGTGQTIIIKMVDVVHDCDFHQLFSGTTAASITDNLVFMVFLATNTANTGGISQVIPAIRTWYVDN